MLTPFVPFIIGEIQLFTKYGLDKDLFSMGLRFLSKCKTFSIFSKFQIHMSASNKVSKHMSQIWIFTPFCKCIFWRMNRKYIPAFAADNISFFSIMIFVSVKGCQSCQPNISSPFLMGLLQFDKLRKNSIHIGLLSGDGLTYPTGEHGFISQKISFSLLIPVWLLGKRQQPLLVWLHNNGRIYRREIHLINMPQIHPMWCCKTFCAHVTYMNTG